MPTPREIYKYLKALRIDDDRDEKKTRFEIDDKKPDPLIEKILLRASKKFNYKK